ncbi:hypothetical protein JOY44_19105 [Phormidium sp. CLA17]|uniref:hypothetical protein n=1 Tax=Leptolyngbya sp. Cla-17 TaxID=2803751 RepID=UPI0019333A49|nr:hypothetical protein [Leptolyngbya sp. Cla-17]MBM0743698.1 hypothetical protein [Leptolyngbya sp. Cla-17]
MNFSSFLRTTSIATAALTCLVAADVRPAFAVQFFTQVDENNALVSYDRVTQIPFTRYLFSGTLEPKVTATLNAPGAKGLFTSDGFQPSSNSSIPLEISTKIAQEIVDRYTFTSFVGSYFAANLPGTASGLILPQSARFFRGQVSVGDMEGEVSRTILTSTGVNVGDSDFLLTLSNPANPSECSNATFPFCGTAAFDYGIAQTLQNVTSYSVSPASVSPASEAVPEPSEMAGSAIAIGLLGLGWSLKRKSVKPLL